MLYVKAFRWFCHITKKLNISLKIATNTAPKMHTKSVKTEQGPENVPRKQRMDTGNWKTDTGSWKMDTEAGKRRPEATKWYHTDE